MRSRYSYFIDFCFYCLMSLSALALPIQTFASDQLGSMDVKNEEGNAWYQQGQGWLSQKLKNLKALGESGLEKNAKNVILVIGDGMSITTLTAARIWQGQQEGKLGEEHFLHFEQYPHTALIKTYNTNQQSPDSAGTMSAIMTGVKTRAGVIGIGPEQPKSICKGSDDYHQETLFEWGHTAGYSTGIVTNTRLTHATPAATYAHTPDRNWERDLLRYPNAYVYGCDSIANQLIETAFPLGLDIALGGGSVMLSAYYDRFNELFSSGLLLQNKTELLSLNDQVVTSKNSDSVRSNIQQAASPKQFPVLGVFSYNHMAFEADRILEEDYEQPSLTLMAVEALKYLQRTNENYLLVVESGRIDHAHHDGNAARALSEASALAKTVERLDALTSDEDTLIIVTADHSHNFIMSGYPKRGNPILGTSKNQLDEEVLANDGLPYTTLGYANGKNVGRQTSMSQRTEEPHDIHKVETTERLEFRQGVAIPLDAATHGSDDVVLHAKGPSAYLFSGLMEQHEIFHTIQQALK